MSSGGMGCIHCRLAAKRAPAKRKRAMAVCSWSETVGFMGVLLSDRRPLMRERVNLVLEKLRVRTAV